MKSGILCGIPGPLKSDLDGVGHCHAPHLQEQLTHVLATASAADQHANAAIDGFHDSEAHLGPAVVHNSIEVLDQCLSQVLNRP